MYSTYISNNFPTQDNFTWWTEDLIIKVDAEARFFNDPWIWVARKNGREKYDFF